MATIKDVAKEAGVSIATASRVINNAPHTSEAAIVAVKEAMEKLGYRPNANARALVSKSSNAIGVLVNDVSAPFFGTMVKAIDTIASEQEKQLLIGSGYHDATKERNAINLLINSQCESLVVHSKGMSDSELCKLAKEIPGMVLINRIVPEIASRCIALDNRKGSYIATEHLIRNGHRHIGYICSSHDIEDARDRREGYLDALRDNGLEIREEYIEYGEPDETGGEQAMVNLVAKNLPITAVATYNDYMAAGCMTLLQENGIRIPEDMSLIGFDDGHIARYIYPRLTTIRYPIQVMANEAVKLSLKLINKESIESTEFKLFIPILVKRSSVSCIES
ncbi:substrate-binding domain-containing protein [Vibrio parahaemolyticus]|uniref:Substrate-binding domain-containing protein n=1 Tax=Vibrio parahaemolyticus TaxID=670 RepID=A0A9Q3UHR2_VIBPH|nr:substrate-binding domain-containing protein [Vibrio parahaemolyticus]EGQ8551033.1 LacI family DNA-binding transcriptional regulator [Vibrio parahaemolyticus]EGQ9074838.1 LacI family DNA-binding transcriptional regulator [Vibrio parahaemolyticus]EGQ9132358.1 LacI family DNA-binding transcriptional regulator [Vibrio parahaemolyticus]EHA6961854.1 substrate-binding domain-containing protein [Vibrio parahaemolyticus]EHA6976234.1 substrate-binding domain-containing protein [Vibrio parahaemolyticu